MTSGYFEAEAVGAHWGHIPLPPVVRELPFDELRAYRKRSEAITFPIMETLVDVQL